MAKSKLRQSARDRDCTLRLPGICNRNPETTVLAHVGRNKGMGIKCHDIHAVFACMCCHDAIDGRITVDYDLSADILRALEETQLIWLEEGLIKA